MLISIFLLLLPSVFFLFLKIRKKKEEREKDQYFSQSLELSPLMKFHFFHIYHK